MVLQVAGQEVRLTTPGRVLYPATGTTKAQVVAFYIEVAPENASAPDGPAGDAQAMAGGRWRAAGEDLRHHPHPANRRQLHPRRGPEQPGRPGRDGQAGRPC